MDPRTLSRCNTHVHDKNCTQAINYSIRSAKILHEIFPVLNCYDEFYIDYCQLVTDVAYTITIYGTIYCYMVKRLNINSALLAISAELQYAYFHA